MSGERPAQSKTAVILLNGEPYRGEIPTENAYVICCDGAYSWAKGKVRIDENLGDFDSLSEPPVPAPRMKFPSEKNETDGELAVERAIELGATHILFYGGGGKREDHFLGNLHLLYKALRAGVFAELITNGAAISLFGKGKHCFACESGTTISLLPFGGGAHIMESSGLKYPLNGLRLCYGTTRGISNIVTGNAFSFTVDEGYVLCVINREGT